MKKEITNPASFVAVSLLEDDRILAAQFTSRTLEGTPTVEVREYQLNSSPKNAAPVANAVAAAYQPIGDAENFEPEKFGAEPFYQAEQVNLFQKLLLDQTVLLAPKSFTFETRTLSLAPEVADLSDVDLAAYLIQTQQGGMTLADGKPLLKGASFEEKVAQMTRLPNEAATLTELPRVELNAAVEKIKNLYLPANLSAEKREAFIEKIPAPIAETPLRAAFRAFLVESRSEDNDLLTVFVMATENGFAFGCWNAAWGLFTELSEDKKDDFTLDDILTGSDEETEQLRNASLAGFFKYALESAHLSATDTMNKMGFAGIERVVLAVPQYCLQITQPVIEEFAELETLDVILIPESIENQVLRGLLYSQIDLNPLAEANLCRDLYVRLVDNSIAVEQARKMRVFERQRKVNRAMIVAASMLIGFVCGSILYYAATAGTLGWRDVAADAEKQRLAPVLSARTSFISNFTVRQAYMTQTLDTKDRQIVPISFLPELAKKFNSSLGDGSLSLSKVKLENNGVFEMTGVAASEDTLTQFVRGLEFATASEISEKRIFSNLTFEVRRETDEKLPASANFKTSFANVPPGYIGWMIKGSYAPLAAIAVPAKNNQSPPKPPAPAAAAPSNPNAPKPNAPVPANPPAAK